MYFFLSLVIYFYLRYCIFFHDLYFCIPFCIFYKSSLLVKYFSKGPIKGFNFWTREFVSEKSFSLVLQKFLSKFISKISRMYHFNIIFFQVVIAELDKMNIYTLQTVETLFLSLFLSTVFFDWHENLFFIRKMWSFCWFFKGKQR